MSKKLQESYYKFTLLFLVFLLLVFDRDLALVYSLIILADWVWFSTDNFISFPLSRPGSNNLKIYIESLVGLGVFLLSSVALVSFFSPKDIIAGGVVGGAQSIFHLLSTTTPILQGSAFLTFLGWALLIPVVETHFFNGTLLEGLATYAERITGQRITFERYTTPLVLVVLTVAALFTLFHLTAKGIQTIPLLITFIFSVVSSVLVIRHRQVKGAVFIHIVVNAMAVLSMWGWF